LYVYITGAVKIEGFNQNKTVKLWQKENVDYNIHILCKMYTMVNNILQKTVDKGNRFILSNIGI